MRLALAALLLSCTPAVRGVAVGSTVPSHPDGCQIRHESLTPKEAQDKYRQVGVVCLSEKLGEQRDLQRAACQLGGDVVVRTGLCSNGEGRHSMQGIEYGVYLDSD